MSEPKHRPRPDLSQPLHCLRNADRVRRWSPAELREDGPGYLRPIIDRPAPADAALTSAVQAGDRLDGQLAVDFFEADQIVSIARSVSKALEGDDAAQTGDQKLDVAIVRWHSARLDGLIVEWGNPPRMMSTSPAPTTTNRASSPTSAAAATSSSGSRAAIGALDGSQQRCRLG
jgi:hypothetical protein